ncbi:hypothetical protein ACC713_18790 [Rhizobium johnstonii]|uniref:hypothetical protein n=1 Tax=Rhizobium johnstonii TaxID=3019933 RepID=UPI003F97D677
MLGTPCDALVKGLCLELRYDGFSRVIEVHAVGTTQDGNSIMRVWQVRGGSNGGERQGWKLMRLDEAFSTHVINEKSEAPRTGYKRGDKLWPTYDAKSRPPQSHSSQSWKLQSETCMATFIITYDTHKGRNYQSFYEGIKAHGGVALAESVWGVELNNTVVEVRDWAKNLLDSDDTIVVFQIKPKLSWATTNAKKPANDWMRENI